MSILFMFPGQGSQRAGMLHALPGDPAVAQTLTEAGDMLGVNPLTLDTAEALRSTVAVQLCLLIAGVAVARTLARQDAGPDMVAGLSIGAWPAAVVAGVLEFSDVLRLVRLRGQLMEDAYPSGYGMVAIIANSGRSMLANNINGAERAEKPNGQGPAYRNNLRPSLMAASGANMGMASAVLLAVQISADGSKRLTLRLLAMVSARHAWPSTQRFRMRS